jgi:hypothetical protein
VQQRERTESAIGAEAFNNHDRPPRRFARGRVCAEPDCATRLSVYNESEYCSLHRVDTALRVRGKKVPSGWVASRSSQ